MCPERKQGDSGGRRPLPPQEGLRGAFAHGPRTGRRLITSLWSLRSNPTLTGSVPGQVAEGWCAGPVGPSSRGHGRAAAAVRRGLRPCLPREHLRHASIYDGPTYSGAGPEGGRAERMTVKFYQRSSGSQQDFKGRKAGSGDCTQPGPQLLGLPAPQPCHHRDRPVLCPSPSQATAKPLSGEDSHGRWSAECSYTDPASRGPRPAAGFCPHVPHPTQGPGSARQHHTCESPCDMYKITHMRITFIYTLSYMSECLAVCTELHNVFLF